MTKKGSSEFTATRRSCMRNGSIRRCMRFQGAWRHRGLESKQGRVSACIAFAATAYSTGPLFYSFKILYLIRKIALNVFSMDSKRSFPVPWKVLGPVDYTIITEFSCPFIILLLWSTGPKNFIIWLNGTQTRIFTNLVRTIHKSIPFMRKKDVQGFLDKRNASVGTIPLTVNSVNLQIVSTNN